MTQVIRLISRCIDMGVGLDMCGVGLDMIGGLAYFAPFVIEEPIQILKLIQ